jgi:hypothetical protein
MKNDLQTYFDQHPDQYDASSQHHILSRFPSVEQLYDARVEYCVFDNQRDGGKTKVPKLDENAFSFNRRRGRFDDNEIRLPLGGLLSSENIESRRFQTTTPKEIATAPSRLDFPTSPRDEFKVLPQRRR